MSKRIKKHTEDEIIELFNLQRLVGNNEHPLMQE
jgi:hypothetical protein